MLPAVRLPRKFCCLHLLSPSNAIPLLMAAQALVPLSSKPLGMACQQGLHAVAIEAGGNQF
jgi:hypothetical protein